MERVEINVGYNGEGYSAVAFFRGENLEVYKGLTQKSKVLMIGVTIFQLKIDITACGEFAETILKLAKRRSEQKIFRLCIEKVCSNMKTFHKLTQNIYHKGFCDGKAHVREEFNKVLRGY